MSSSKWQRRLASGMLVAAAAILGAACSSSSSQPPPVDGGPDVKPPPLRADAGGMVEAGPTTGADGSVAANDGTTGMRCTTDAECQIPNGPKRNTCATSIPGGPLYPTPVCLDLQSSCDLGDGTLTEFCDGPSISDPTSPGICLPAGSGTTGMNGQCFPKCTILGDGSRPVGCAGSDACNVAAWGTDRLGRPVALGLCFGGCVADTDCPSGSQCQKDVGECKTTPLVATKQLGQNCTSGDRQATAYGCNCLSNPMTNVGYCSQFCIAGPTSPAPCPSGYVCDTSLPAQITTGTGAPVPGFTVQNIGLAGTCVLPCSGGSGDAGGGSVDAGDGGTCPATVSCSTQDAVGPVCFP